MIIQTTINWNEGQQNAKVIQQQQNESQAEKLADFLSESHEMTDARDLQYWIDETGKDIYFLLHNAQDIAPNMKEAILGGADLDDIWNLEPKFPEDDYNCNDEDCEEVNQIFRNLFNS